MRFHPYSKRLVDVNARMSNILPARGHWLTFERQHRNLPQKYRRNKTGTLSGTHGHSFFRLSLGLVHSGCIGIISGLYSCGGTYVS